MVKFFLLKIKTKNLLHPIISYYYYLSNMHFRRITSKIVIKKLLTNNRIIWYNSNIEREVFNMRDTKRIKKIL